MAYNEELATRIRKVVEDRKGVTEKQMFGGVAFMFDAKMFVGIVGEDLMVRVGPEAHDASIAKPHVRPMDFTGRPMKGYVYVAPDGVKTAKALKAWVDQGAAFVATVEKKAKPKKKKAAKPKPKTTKSKSKKR